MSVELILPVSDR